MVVIQKSYITPVFVHAVRNFVNQKAFSSKHVSTFLPRKYDISQFCLRDAKDPNE